MIRKLILILVLVAPLNANELGLKDKPVKEKVYGVPVGSDIFYLKTADTIDMYFVVNNLKDRVGVFFEACLDPTGGTDRNCENLTYLFPDLTYDNKKKVILLKGEQVAKYGGSPESTSITKPFALGYEVERILVDSGFDKHQRTKVKIYLGKEIK